MPKISVIVPIYKVEAYLENCISSLLKQTYTDFELILVDDGSPDRCGMICDEWAQKDSRIHVIHRENGGLSAARNSGIELANGEYFVFVDSDDDVKPTLLSYLLGLFLEEPTALVTACNHTVVRGDKKKNSTNFSGRRFFARNDAFEEVLYHGIIDVSAWGKMYHRSIFDGLRYPEGRLYEDTYIFGEVLNKTPGIVFGGEPQYLYIQHDHSIVNGGFSEKRLEFLESVERLTDAAMRCDSTLKNACIRRHVHACLSVLRYMETCDEVFYSKREELRRYVLQNAKTVLKDPRTPQRDKMALHTLAIGLKAFYFSWKLYGKVR